MASSTTSFRISDELKTRLSKLARRTRKNKNQIITEALKEYLDRENREEFLAEARRQSILASQTPWKDEELWERALGEVWDRE